MAKPEGRGIQSIEVGGRLLSQLVSANGPIMLKDLAALADLAPAQAHAYLASYRRVGLVEQDAETGRYSLGPAAVRLAVARMRSTEPTASASKAAIELANRLGLMVAIVMWGPHAPTAIQILEGEDRLNINLQPGAIFSVTRTPAGWIFDAFGDKKLVEARIDIELTSVVNHGVSGSMARRRTARELEAIQRQGFAGAVESPVPGLSSMAAPVFGTDGSLAYAISVIGRSADLEIKASGGDVQAMLETTRLLSTVMGSDSRSGKASTPGRVQAQ